MAQQALRRSFLGHAAYFLRRCGALAGLWSPLVGYAGNYGQRSHPRPAVDNYGDESSVRHSLNFYGPLSTILPRDRKNPLEY